MNICKRLLLAAALMSYASSVIAQTLGYTFVSLGHTKYSVIIDGVSKSLYGSGVSFDAALAIRPHIALVAGFSKGKADVSINGLVFDAEIDSTSLGFLIHAAINDYSDFIIGAGFINGKANVTKSVNGSTDSVDADGGVTLIGFRTMVLEQLEINGFIRKITIEDFSSISISLAAGFYVEESVSLNVDYRVDSEDGSDLLTFGVTKYF